MITKKQTHSRFDAKVFELDVEAKDLKRELTRFNGQPRVLIGVAWRLSAKGTRTFSGKVLREYLERNRAKLFPSTNHRDVLRIFQIYRAQLRRSNIVVEI